MMSRSVLGRRLLWIVGRLEEIKKNLLILNFTPRPLSPGKQPWYPWNTRLTRSQSRYGRFIETKNLLLPPEFEPRTFHPVA